MPLSELRPGGRSWWRPRGPMPALLVVLLLAFGLRVYELGKLSLYGDFAYSVYAARQGLAAIAQERVLDGHPPLYYYLLHFWMLLSGQTELTTRMLSVLIGMLAVPLAYSFAARRLGRLAGTLGALFVAVSPPLVHYSRLPRMYILLATLGLLSAYALDRALRDGRRRHWLAYFAATSLLLYTHYYGLALVLAEGAYVLWLHRRREGRLRRWIVATGAVAAVYAPWLLFAGASAAATTAGIISNAPWPHDLQGLTEQFWIPFNVGDFLDITLARPLSLVLLALWGVTIVVQRRHLGRQWRALGLLVCAIGVPIAGSLVLFAFIPYAVRPRFLIFCIPPYLVLLAAVLGGARRWLAAAGALRVLAISGYTLIEAYAVEPYAVEADAISLTQHIESVATPEDAVVFQAFWQIGYFTTHYRGTMPTIYNLRDLSMGDAEALLSRHPRVWLAMYRVRERDPDYPLEEWLDRNWYKAERLLMGDTRLLSYVRPAPGRWQDTALDFETSEGAPLLRLTSVQMAGSDVVPGGTLAVGLRWQALASLSERYTVFLQLIDAGGRRWAGADREPLGGSEPTAGWREGRRVEDHMGLVVSPEVPPGEYALRVGLYPTGRPQPLVARGADGSAFKQGVDVGRVSVSSTPVEALRVRHPLDVRLGDAIALLGYDLDTDEYQVRDTRTLVALTDNPIQLSFPKCTYRASDTVEFTLYWRALHPLEGDYTVFVHLQDAAGRLWGQADGQPAMGSHPTSRWRAGEVIVDKYRLRIDGAAPPGDYSLRVGMYLLSTMERLGVSGP
ncbi:MAG: glycosyltransferase family 39 protein, partial [Chloroflexi bacterium]|nr:glycosyltransferase family 39 protein [Chloroflexota bacterium]